MIGKTVNGYKIIRKIGEGGMATVYEAVNELGKAFALKILKPDLANDPKVRSWFKQEATIMVDLDGIDGICSVFERVEGEDGSLGIVMEHLKGMNLSSWIKTKGTLNPSVVKRIALQVARAMGEAHKRGVIHRDIKPSNLFYVTDGTIKILDFGISKMLFGDGSDATLKETTTHQAKGTLSYMSPEQIQCREDIDQRTDIYSLGLTLYYLLTGSDPVTMEEDSLQVIGDESLIKIIKLTTRKDRDKRLESCEELIALLESPEAKFDSSRFINYQREGETMQDKFPEIGLITTSLFNPRSSVLKGRQASQVIYMILTAIVLFFISVGFAVNVNSSSFDDTCAISLAGMILLFSLFIWLSGYLNRILKKVRKYDYIEKYRCRYLTIVKDEKFGIIDLNQNKISLPVSYIYIFTIIDQQVYGIVGSSGKFGLYNPMLKQLVEPKYDAMESELSNGRITAYLGDKRVYFDSTGRQLK